MSTWGLIEDTTLSGIADAIREKTGGTDEITPAEMAEEIGDIMVYEDEVTSGVNFIDYEGHVLYSYSWDEIAELDELPTLPDRIAAYEDHTVTLSFKEWNYSLEDIKNYYGSVLYVGAIYEPSDGASHLIFDVYPGLSLSLFSAISIEDGGSVTVDWGDGTKEEITAAGAAHTYDGTGETEVVITTDNATAVISSSAATAATSNGIGSDLSSTSSGSAGRAHAASLIGAHFGGGIALGQYGLFYCQGLKHITFTELLKNTAGASFIRCAYSLPALIFPDTSGGALVNSAAYLYALQKVSIPGAASLGNYALCYGSFMSLSLPAEITSIGNYALAYEFALKRLELPDNEITFGSYSLAYNSALASVSIPGGIASGTGHFTGDCALSEIEEIGAVSVSVDFADCPLTYDSLLAVIAALAETTDALTLTLGTTNLAKLTDDEIAEATDKGWTVTA